MGALSFKTSKKLSKHVLAGELGEKIMLKYIYSEIKYGCNLYIANWKKLIFHPWQTVRDIGRAIRHPVKTAKALGRELKKHPIGMTVNIGLNWATGRAIGEGIEYLGYLKENASAIVSQNSSSLSSPSSSNFPSLSNPVSNNNAHILYNTSGPLHPHSPEVGGIFPAILQIVQYGGGCGCAGVCATATTATTVGQTASFSNQAEVFDHRAQNNNTYTLEKNCCLNSECGNTKQQQNNDVLYSSFTPYFNVKRDARSERTVKVSSQPAQKVGNKSECKL